ncbi:MAG: heavy metal-responsive transcriptional regulator [Thiogranum sp.]
MNSRTSPLYRISVVSKRLGLSADTLRYYEKIALIPKVQRSDGGVRLYSEADLSRLRFIRRAQAMNFSLAEIGDLLNMREDPQHARDEVRELTRRKLAAVEQQLTELDTLRRELQLLVNLCAGSKDGCPIIDGIDKKK